MTEKKIGYSICSSGGGHVTTHTDTLNQSAMTKWYPEMVSRNGKSRLTLVDFNGNFFPSFQVPKLICQKIYYKMFLVSCLVSPKGYPW